MQIQDQHNCVLSIVHDHDVALAGPLAGLHYMVKDIFNVAGLPTTCCSPDFSKHYGIPDKDSWAVWKLRQSGAELVAKTHMHELAMGITGINPHYGTPGNPRAEGRIPGGSSSGSAVAVAADMVPFSLGTDTGGSVRVPAGFCGIYSLRPTFGHIPVEGVVPLAFSLDTVGVFAKTAGILKTVSELLLTSPCTPPKTVFRKALLALDALEMSEPEITDAARKIGSRLEKLGLALEGKNIGLLEQARDTQRIIQGAEAWARHKNWLDGANPNLGADVQSLFSFGKGLSSAQLGAASANRAALTLALQEMLGDDAIMIIPTAPSAPPRIADLANQEDAFSFRSKILCFTNLASLTGHPVAVVPTSSEQDLPIGFQLIGPKGSDSALLQLARDFETKGGN